MGNSCHCDERVNWYNLSDGQFDNIQYIKDLMHAQILRFVSSTSRNSS